MLLVPEKSSYSVLLFKKLSIKYRIFGDSLRRIGMKSKIYKVVTILINRIKLCLKYSFLGRISELNGQGNQRLLNESRVVQYFINFHNNLKQKILNSLSTSGSLSKLERFKKDFYSLPLKTESMIMIVAVVSNIFLSLLIRDEISRSGWLIRGLLLFLGICGFGSFTNWATIRKGSITLKLNTKK